MTGLPDPIVARNAVGMPATPVSTLNPPSRRASARMADDFVSL
jgi:hypothetical protein